MDESSASIPLAPDHPVLLRAQTALRKQLEQRKSALKETLRQVRHELKVKP